MIEQFNSVRTLDLTTPDGRKQRIRKARTDYHCTGCGCKLPDSTEEWGLIWDSQIHGFCKVCLSTIRERVGVKPRKKKKRKSEV